MKITMKKTTTAATATATTTRAVRDGWHIASGMEVYCEGGKVLRAVKRGEFGQTLPAMPYRAHYERRALPGGGSTREQRGWAVCDGISLAAFRALAYRGRACVL